MSNNMYLREKLQEAHRQDIQQEIEQQRMLAGLAHRRGNPIRHTISKLGTGLVSFGSWLEKIEPQEQLQRSEVMALTSRARAS